MHKGSHKAEVKTVQDQFGLFSDIHTVLIFTHVIKQNVFLQNQNYSRTELQSR